MSLTPEEQRAVEKTRRWSMKFTDSDADAYDCFYEVFSGEGDAAGFACGYLDGDRDGYRRGVEAAAKMMETDEAPLTKSEWDRAGSALAARANRIRALLAQEEQRG